MRGSPTVLRAPVADAVAREDSELVDVMDRVRTEPGRVGRTVLVNDVEASILPLFLPPSTPCPIVPYPSAPASFVTDKQIGYRQRAVVVLAVVLW